MLLKALHLRNIRSYVDERIEFPDGMTLLAGDIGSGKSTILLALEFALFGIQRGELSGAALLRHGARHGEVALTLEISGVEMRITRSLKRGPNNVSQETGSLVVDGVTTEATAQELKAKVLALLNYPSALLTKGKRPLWRYTVYTPQEEMKAIIYEGADDRIDTLRKLFDIDKYKRVENNAANLIRGMRKEETDLSARIDELGKTATDAKETRARLAELSEKRKGLSATLKAEQEKLAAQQATLERLDKERFAIEELRKRMAVAKNQLDNTLERQAEVRQDQKTVDEQIRETGRRLAPADADEALLATVGKKLDEHEARIRAKEAEFLTKETEQRAIIKRAEAVMESVQALTHCPTCRQDVDDEHKNSIRQEEERRIGQAEERLAHLASLKPELEKKRAKLDEKRAELRQKQGLVAANKEKLKTLEGLKRRRESMEQLLTQLKGHEQGHRTSYENAKKGLAEKEGVDEQEHAALKKRYETQRTAVERLRVSEAELKKEREGVERELARIEARKQERARYERELRAVQRRLAWVSKHLLNVSRAVERAMFTSIYGLFNEYFKEWFATLMEDETLSVRLDAGFTPVIVQDGYETSIDHLSGGEKTSIALAYRLSLNKAINEFLSHINTKDLLVLDEPTDGFSSEQLDRVRDVLEQLKLKQVLIVSHEAQMEGYVDHVIRIEKTGHESRIVGL